MAADRSQMDGDTPLITFTAAAVRTPNRSRPIQIHLERWSTDEEKQRVARAFESDATPGELAKQFREMEAIGSFRTITGQANPIRYAAEFTGDDGTQHLVFLTDSQIPFWTGAMAPGTIDQAYTVIEVRSGGDIQGEGKYTHSDVTVDAAEGRIMIEDYDDKNVALIGVHRFGSEEPIDKGK